MKLVKLIVFFYGLKSFLACRTPPPKPKGVEKPPWERDWNKWDLPPNNADWKGFVDLLGTRDNLMSVTNTTTPKKTVYGDENIENVSGFPERWLEVGAGSTGPNPPLKAKLHDYYGAAAFCLDPVDPGNGTTYWFLRWYYDSRKGRCRRFVYTGYGGNANMFLTKSQCLKHCLHPPAPCCVPETRFDFEKYLSPHRRLLKRRNKYSKDIFEEIRTY